MLKIPKPEGCGRTPTLNSFGYQDPSIDPVSLKFIEQSQKIFSRKDFLRLALPMGLWRVKKFSQDILTAYELSFILRLRLISDVMGGNAQKENQLFPDSPIEPETG